MNSSARIICFAVVALLGMWQLPTSAGPANLQVVKNLSTAIDDATGEKLPDGAPDYDYVIGPGGSGRHVGAVSVAEAVAFRGVWVSDDVSPDSRWIIIGNGEGFVPVGAYFFEKIFARNIYCLFNWNIYRIVSLCLSFYKFH